MLAVCLFDNVQHTTSCQQVRCLVQNSALTLGRNGHSSEVKSIDAQPLTRHQFCKDLKRSKQSMMLLLCASPFPYPVGPAESIAGTRDSVRKCCQNSSKFFEPDYCGDSFSKYWSWWTFISTAELNVPPSRGQDARILIFTSLPFLLTLINRS